MGALASRLAACAVAGLLAACASPTTDLRTASDATASEKRANIRLQLAAGYYREGKYEVALDEVKKAIAADPDLAEAYGMRGLVYAAMNEKKLAEASFRRALDIAPRDPELANNYGSFLCQNGQEAKAIQFFDAALANRNYASPVSAMVNAGTCSIKLKRLDAAERYLLDALRFAPDLPVTNAALARIYYDRGDYARAQSFISRVMSATRVENLTADVLWLAVRVGRKSGERAMEPTLVGQLYKKYPGSPEYAAFQRGAFDE